MRHGGIVKGRRYLLVAELDIMIASKAAKPWKKKRAMQRKKKISKAENEK